MKQWLFSFFKTYRMDQNQKIQVFKKSKKASNLQEPDQKAKINNFQENSEYSTPKKQIIYRQDNEQTNKRRLKSIYTKRQVHSNRCYSVIMIWMIVISFLFLVSAYDKYQVIDKNAKNQLQQCRIDYYQNKCDTPTIGIKQYCLKKDKCRNSSVEQLKIGNISTGLIVGKVISQFSQGTGLILLILGAITMSVILIYGKQSVIEIQKKEYYDD